MAAPLLEAQAASASWWDAVSLGARPQYAPVEVLERPIGNRSVPLFDEDGRLLFADSAVRRYDGERWATLVNEAEMATLALTDERLWIADLTSVAYAERTAGGFGPLQWLESFAKRTESAPPRAAAKLPAFPGMFFVVGGEIWHWTEEETRRLYASGYPAVFPFLSEGAWHVGEEDGTVLRLTPDGAGAQRLVFPGVEGRVMWFSQEANAVEGVTLDGRFRSTAEATEVVPSKALDAFLREGWYTGTLTSPAGWKLITSFSSGFMVYPPEALEPIELGLPELSTGMAENQLWGRAFDPSGNLWLNTSQGLYRWEHPGRVWRWLERNVPVTALRLDEGRVFASAVAHIFRIDPEGTPLGRLTSDNELVFDSISVGERIVLTSRGFISNAGTPGTPPDAAVDDDFLRILSVDEEEGWFILFGANQIHLAHFPPEAEQAFIEPLVDLPAPTDDAVHIDGAYHYVLRDGSVHRLRLRPREEGDGGFRLREISQLKPATGRGPLSTLTVVNGRVVQRRGGQLSVLEPGTGRFAALPTKSQRPVSALCALAGDTVLATLRTETPGQPFFAVIDLAGGDATARYFWYPG
ncbi:MAG: hypothetical protein ACLFR7_08650, partial [Opitutales bacterium]